MTKAARNELENGFCFIIRREKHKRFVTQVSDRRRAHLIEILEVLNMRVATCE